MATRKKHTAEQVVRKLATARTATMTLTMYPQVRISQWRICSKHLYTPESTMKPGSITITSQILTPASE